MMSEALPAPTGSVSVPIKQRPELDYDAITIDTVDVRSFCPIFQQLMSNVPYALRFASSLVRRFHFTTAPDRGFSRKGRFKMLLTS
jgi:hypothetical protein